jgi:hypothetical protein
MKKNIAGARRPDTGLPCEEQEQKKRPEPLAARKARQIIESLEIAAQCAPLETSSARTRADLAIKLLLPESRTVI